MLFSSVQFIKFFIIFYGLYLVFSKNIHAQNFLILIFSLWFYGSWSLQYLAMLVLLISFDYLVGLGLGRVEDPKKRQRLLVSAVVVNLSILGVFKYYNFFASSILAVVGSESSAFVLNLILPL